MFSFAAVRTRLLRLMEASTTNGAASRQATSAGSSTASAAGRFSVRRTAVTAPSKPPTGSEASKLTNVALRQCSGMSPERRERNCCVERLAAEAVAGVFDREHVQPVVFVPEQIDASGHVRGLEHKAPSLWVGPQFVLQKHVGDVLVAVEHHLHARKDDKTRLGQCSGMSPEHARVSVTSVKRLKLGSLEVSVGVEPKGQESAAEASTTTV